MTSSRYASTLAIIALVTLGACQKKEPEPAAPAKPVTDAAKAPVAQETLDDIFGELGA